MALGELKALRNLELTICDLHPISYVLSKLPCLQNLHVKNVCTLDGLLDDTMTPHEHLRNVRVTPPDPKRFLFGHDEIIEFFKAHKDKLPNLVLFGQAATKYYCMHEL